MQILASISPEARNHTCDRCHRRADQEKLRESHVSPSDLIREMMHKSSKPTSHHYMFFPPTIMLFVSRYFPSKIFKHDFPSLRRQNSRHENHSIIRLKIKSAKGTEIYNTSLVRLGAEPILRANISARPRPEAP